MGEEGGSPRQRLRALFNRRRAEGQTAADNVGNGAEGRSPFRLRRIRPRRPLTAEKREEEEGQIIGVSSSVSTSSSSEVRRRPLIKIPARLLNNVNIQQSSGGRRRFRPSVDRSKLRKK